MNAWESASASLSSSNDTLMGGQARSRHATTARTVLPLLHSSQRVRVRSSERTRLRFHVVRFACGYTAVTADGHKHTSIGMSVRQRRNPIRQADYYLAAAFVLHRYMQFRLVNHAFKYCCERRRSMSRRWVSKMGKPKEMSSCK